MTTHPPSHPTRGTVHGGELQVCHEHGAEERAAPAGSGAHEGDAAGGWTDGAIYHREGAGDESLHEGARAGCTGAHGA